MQTGMLDASVRSTKFASGTMSDLSSKRLILALTCHMLMVNVPVDIKKYVLNLIVIIRIQKRFFEILELG